jgi:hypothetical protein
VDDPLAEIRHRAQAPLRLVVGEVEEEQGDDAGLHVEAHEGDHAHPDRDRDLVVERPEEPDRADDREGNGEDDDERLRQRARIGTEGEEDQTIAARKSKPRRGNVTGGD